MNMDVLKLEKNRGYVIAGIAGIIGLIAFFLPYITVSFLGVSESVGGSSGGWVWFEEIGALVVAAASAILIFRNNAFGLSNMPVVKQIQYGRYAIIGGAVLALLIHLLFALDFHSVVGGVGDFSGVSLGFGFWVFLLTAIAMVVGGVLALRSPIPVEVATAMPGAQASQPWQYPQQQTQYPPYQQPYSQPGLPQNPQQYQQPSYPQAIPPQQPYQQPGYPPQQPQQPQQQTPYPGQQQAYPAQQPPYQPPQQDPTQLYQPPQSPQPPQQPPSQW